MLCGKLNFRTFLDNNHWLLKIWAASLHWYLGVMLLLGDRYCIKLISLTLFIKTVHIWCASTSTVISSFTQIRWRKNGKKLFHRIQIGTSRDCNSYNPDFEIFGLFIRYWIFIHEIRIIRMWYLKKKAIICNAIYYEINASNRLTGIQYLIVSKTWINKFIIIRLEKYFFYYKPLLPLVW